MASRWARYQQREADLAAGQDMLDSSASDADMADMAQEEIDSATAEIAQLEGELQRMLLPKDPDDARNAFVEIRAGTGGDESALFAGDLLRMYTRYCRPLRLEDRDRQRVGQRTGRLQGGGGAHGGHTSVVRHAQVRVRRPPRAARARHRNPGPHSHQRLHGGGAGRAGRGRGHQDQPGRLAHRHLPRQRRRWPAHQQDRLGGAHHPPAHRHRGRMPGRPQPAQQQGAGAQGADRPHPRKRPRPNAPPKTPPSARA